MLLPLWGLVLLWGCLLVLACCVSPSSCLCFKQNDHSLRLLACLCIVHAARLPTAGV
jgi:hypothetical protein